MEKDIQEIKADVKEILQRTAVHNSLLATHESRSLALQAGQEKLDARIKPIETHVELLSVLLKIAGVIASGVALQAAVKYLL